MVNKTLFDSTVIHQTYLLRRANGISKDVLKLLAAAEKDIIARIATAHKQKELGALLKDVRARIVEMTAEVSGEIGGSLSTLGVHEGNYQSRTLGVMINTGVAAPTEDALAAIYLKDPILGIYYKTRMKNLGDAAISRIAQAIRLGYAESESMGDIIKRVRDVSKITENAATRVVRTSVNSIANTAKQLTYQQNSKLIDKWQFVATLDSRTSLICVNLDGKEYPVGEGPMPPRHDNCRSTIIPVLKDDFDIGGTRASADGQVDANITYPQWLKTQPVSVQKEVLGTARQKLWADGRIEINSFTNDAGRTLTLDELKIKDS